MKVSKMSLTLALCIAAVAVCYASDANMGSWKLNDAKSKFPAGATKNTSVVYTAMGDQVKVTTDGTTGDGKAAHTEWTGMFDGKDYPLTGDPNADTRAYKKMGNNMELINKKDGKATATGHIMVSPDGMTRTVKVSGTGADGKKFAYTAVYDKQQ